MYCIFASLNIANQRILHNHISYTSQLILSCETYLYPYIYKSIQSFTTLKNHNNSAIKDIGLEEYSNGWKKGWDCFSISHRVQQRCTNFTDNLFMQQKLLNGRNIAWNWILYILLTLFTEKRHIRVWIQPFPFLSVFINKEMVLDNF